MNSKTWIAVTQYDVPAGLVARVHPDCTGTIELPDTIQTPMTARITAETPDKRCLSVLWTGTVANNVPITFGGVYGWVRGGNTIAVEVLTDDPSIAEETNGSIPIQERATDVSQADRHCEDYQDDPIDSFESDTTAFEIERKRVAPDADTRRVTGSAYDAVSDESERDVDVPETPCTDKRDAYPPDELESGDGRLTFDDMDELDAWWHEHTRETENEHR